MPSDITTFQEKFEAAANLQRQGDFSGAIRKYNALLKEAPGHPQLLNLSAVCHLQTGKNDQAIQLLEQAVESAPEYPDAWLNLGLACQQAAEYDQAARAYERVKALVPDSPAGHANFANVCQLLHRYDDAVSAYKTALKIAPNDPELWTNNARASLYAGDWNRALDASNRAIELKPGNTSAMSTKSAALLELGKTHELGELVDFDRLVAVSEFEAPKQFGNIQAFNEALCDHCRNHPSLMYEPGENTTRKGHQTGNLSLDDDQGPIANLLDMIGKAVAAYQEARPKDPAHPFLAMPPENWKYDIWATILGSQGHQAPHIHRSGWLSGCYYARIPEIMESGASGEDGWIEFGRPQDYPHRKADPMVRAYKPHEGMVVLFPSYFYHCTIPFSSEEERISIAFDIVPVQ